MNERDRAEVIKVDLSQLSDENFMALVGGKDYEYVRPIQEIDEELADTIVTISEVLRSGGVRGTPSDMTEELTIEVNEEGLNELNNQLSTLNISTRF